MLICQRVGVRRFYIQAAKTERVELRASLGLFRDSFDIVFIESPSQVIGQVPDSTPVRSAVGQRGSVAREPSGRGRIPGGPFWPGSHTEKYRHRRQHRGRPCSAACQA